MAAYVSMFNRDFQRPINIKKYVYREQCIIKKYV